MNIPFTKGCSLLDNQEAIKLLYDNQVTLFACDVARLVLPYFEHARPNKKEPREAVETAELFLCGEVTKKQLNRIAFMAFSETYSVDVLANNVANAAAYAAWTAFNMNNIHHAAYTVYYATLSSNPQIYSAIQAIYNQALPKTDVPITPILKAIANQIVQTRNFQEYNILLDNLEECHNIRLERTIPLGLSHYVLYTLTNTH